MPESVADGQEGIDANARLAAIVESSDDAIISKSLEGIIASWNMGAERIFGYTADEIIGRPMTTLFPPERFEEEPLILARIQKGERVNHFETVRIAKDGRLLDISATISPVRDATGRIVGASKIARDITAQKRTERELREARDAAEAANRAKDHFLSVLSHELRTPLTPVLAAVSLIHDDPTMPVEELLAHVDMIRRNVETEARLVDDLLDLTRISQGKVRLHMETVDAHVAVRNVVAMLQSNIDEKSLEITLALRAQAHWVWADPGRFQQILLNLLSNAVKFTPRDGSVAIRTSDDPLGGDCLKIDIIDTGIGIDIATLPRLFEPFEQGEQTVTRKFGGLGLGLSIVRSLVKLHGGSIAAASEGTGKGSTFSLRIKAVAAARSTISLVASPASLENAARAQPCRVLLLEDHDDTRAVLSKLLGSIHCQVTTASTVSQALTLLGQKAFDLLVSDIGLPDGSGLDVMRVARERYKISGVALSGFGQESDLKRSQEAGFDQHLIKPINFDTLRKIVEHARG